MIKKKNKIKVILTEDGSIKKIELPVKIHTGSVNMTDIEVFVPITVNRTSTSFVKIYGNTINEKGEKVWSSETYNINFKTIDVIDKFEYAVYEDKFPDEFSNISGDLNLTLAYADLDNEGSIIDVLPSQTIHLHVSGAGFNENGINISNYDATVARVNLLSELSIFKLDLSKELPLGIIFNKDGYKSPFYNFYTIEYTLPINASETAIKQCRVIANSIVKDSESPEVIGYQTEYAYFDGGICKRTNKYNISQGSVNNYVLLESGVWEIVNQDYITPIKIQVDQNSEDIEVLYRLVNTGSTPLGDYPSQDTVPTDSELNSFVQENFGREPQNGDELTFVLLVEDGTDIVYILKYSEVTQSWGKTALPSVEPAKNGSLGIIQGTSEETIRETRKVLVDINNGEINDILHNNENGEKESLSSQTNRNSQNIAINTKDISDNQENLNIEITRAKEEEQTIANNLSAEIERAKQSEQTNTTAIENEVTRATSKEEEKLDKVNINDNYLKDIVFSVNGDNGVANVELNNPVTGETKTIEITVTSPASSTNTGLMTANMVQALNNAIEDIESLKYIGKQVASFQTHAEAELFDFSTLSNVKINDYFIIQADESRTEPTENGKTTRYVCINDNTPISLESFQFQGVVTTVNIQVATESKLGGVLSTNTDGYIYVENSGAMKLVGYDKIITNINNLISNITGEIERAKQAEENLNQAVAAETTRAQNAENNLQNVKADKTEIPTKLSELNNDSNYAKTEQIPTKTSQLANDSNFATINQIPTKTSQLLNDSNFVAREELKNYMDLISNQRVYGEKIFENAQGSFDVNSYTSSVKVNAANSWLRPILLKNGYLYCYQYNCILKIKLSNNSISKIDIGIVAGPSSLDKIFVVNDKIISPAKNDDDKYGSILIYDTNTDTYDKILITEDYSQSFAVIDNIVYIGFSGETNSSGIWYKYLILENKIEGPFNLSLLQDCNIILKGFIKSSDGIYGIVRGVGTSNVVNQSTYYIGKLNETNNKFENFVLTSLYNFSNICYIEHEQRIYISSGYIKGYYDIITKTWNDINATIPGVGSVDFNQYIKIQGDNLYLLDHKTRIVKFDFNSTSYTVEETLPYTDTVFILDSTDTSAYGMTKSEIYFYKRKSYSNFVTLDQLNKLLDEYVKKS